ncbi:MAG: ABC-type transport auxiliary lipoprotein family protein [Candidatus Omnitrophica bacterium]|nr:ABC-type transport auxiliary lipoprotein family protein [Candidatus Omnitrophota bacterium]
MKMKLLFLFLSICLCGCITVSQDYLDIQSYSLGVDRVQDVGSDQAPIRLKVKQLLIVSPYDRKQFVYQMQNQSFETDYYNRWDRPLHYMVTDIVLDWFAASASVKEVIGAKFLKKYDYILSGQVKHFYADFSDPSAYEVVIEIRFSLQSNFIFPEDVFSQIFIAHVPIHEKSIGAIIHGYNQGLEQILMDLEGKISSPLRIDNP